MRKAAIWGIMVVAALSAGTLAAGAQAADLAAAISHPAHASVITGEQATVTVLFDAGPEGKVTAAELYVDGALHDAIAINPPVSSGSCKLTWRCGEFEPGAHLLSARVYDASGYSRVVDVEVTLKTSGDRDSGQLLVEISAPRPGQELSGLTQVRVVTDESRVRYVMLLIDDVFVALTNMPPFTFALDTTRYLNGPHVLVAKAFDLNDNPSDSEPVSIIINNPGGRTEMGRQPAAAPRESAPPPASASEPVSAQTAVATAAESLAGPALAQSVADGPGVGAAAPSMAMPREPVRIAPRAQTTAASRAAAPLATAQEPPQPVSAQAAQKPGPAPAAPDGRATPAATTQAAAVLQTPVAAPASPEPAQVVSALPSGAVQVVRAPVARDAEFKPAVSTAALPTNAGPASDSAIEPPAAARPAEPRSAAPATQSARAGVMAALPAAARRATPEPQSAPSQGLSTAAAAVETARLAPEIVTGVESAPAPLVQIARAPSPPVAVSAARTERGDVILHTVQAGEQLGTIAARYDVPAAVIARFNGLAAQAEPGEGRTLRIPWQSALVLNGEPVYTDVPLVTEGGISLAPFRAIIEHAGGAVHWIAPSKQVRALAFSRDIRVTIGSRVALVDNAQYPLEAAPRLVRERALVPLGLFRDALGLQVTFDEQTGRIYLAAR